MKKVLLIFFVMLSAFGYAQHHNRFREPKFNEKKEAVNRKLREYLGSIKYHGEITDLDSALKLRIAITHSEDLVFTYYFDSDRKFNAYNYSGCDTCVKGYLNNILNNKKSGWRRLNDSTYYSKYSEHLMIEIDNRSNSLSFSVKRISIPKSIYNDLFKDRLINK